MASNEEPALSELANIQLTEPSKPIPEQVSFRPVAIPRPVSFLSIIHQWQPMGIRVVLDLPFVGDDSRGIFYIRNGPYIPDHRDKWYMNDGTDISVYAFNSMNAVMSLAGGSAYPKNFPVHFTYYDSPPLLSQISRCFRRWRGDMQYRIRVVSGFVTQGYLLAGPLKNSPYSPGQYNEYTTSPIVFQTDSTSFKPIMQNAYLMSDSTMYRHLEITYPYEYPTPWYDQFQWIENRTAVSSIVTDSAKKRWAHPMPFLEPFADNWLVLFSRGALQTNQASSQITFELEYRAVEGFQFADPNLPPYNIHYPKSAMLNMVNPWANVKIIPASNWTSDGISTITKATTLSGVSDSRAAENLAARILPHHTSGRMRHSRTASDIPDDADQLQAEKSHPYVFEEMDPTEIDPKSEVEDMRTPSQRRRDSEFVY